MRHSLLFGFILSALFTSCSYAQLTFGAPSTALSSTDVVTYFGGPTATATTGANSVSLNLKVDWNWDQIPQNLEENHNDVATISLIVGPLPVLVSNLQLTENAKWVNGGGTTASPITTWANEAVIYQVGGVSSNVLDTGYDKGTQTGSGYTMINDSSADNGQSVLAAGLTYQLQVYVSTTVDPSGLTESDPSSVVTLDGGAASGFPGFTGSFNWQTVPEPTTLCLMAPMSLGLLKRRRRA
jgi:hypothetical protein